MNDMYLKRVIDMYRFIFYAAFSYFVVFEGGGVYYKKGRFMHLSDKYYAAEYDIAKMHVLMLVNVLCLSCTEFCIYTYTVNSNFTT